MSAQPIEPPPPDTYAITSDNRLAVEALLNNIALPAPTLVARPNAVHVTLADVDDLARWMYELGGEVRRGVEISGASLWTLHTETPVRLNGTTVRILVHVPVVSGEDVLAELRPVVEGPPCAFKNAHDPHTNRPGQSDEYRCPGVPKSPRTEVTP